LKKDLDLMWGLKGRIEKLIWNQIRKFIFRPSRQEQKCRQEFFYNAFKALSFNGIDGDYAEFGCYGGMTFALAYHESRRHRHKARLWAFDSFRGLPSSKETGDEHPAWQQGTMATSLEKFHAICASNGIPSDAYSVIPGFYDQTLTGLSPDDAPKNIALAYVDCDLYSSTKAVLQFLIPRLKHGMIIAFDDYFCWSASQISGERKAMLEFLGHDARWSLLPYLQFGWHGNSFVIEDRRIVDQHVS
jgi:O-methyltransferase